MSASIQQNESQLTILVKRIAPTTIQAEPNFFFIESKTCTKHKFPRHSITAIISQVHYFKLSSRLSKRYMVNYQIHQVGDQDDIFVS